MPEADLDQALEQIGYGVSQVIIMVVSYLITLYTVTESICMSFVIILTSCKWLTTPQQKTLMASSMLYGMIASGMFMGYLADRYGRKTIIRVSMLGCLICSHLSSIMPNLYAMSVFRLISGLFLSGSASLAVAFLMEFHPPLWRPKAAIFLSYSIGLGIIYCPVAGMIILPTNVTVHITKDFELQTWTALMLSFTIPGWLAVIGVSLVPDTPYFLLFAEKEEKALDALKWMSKLNGKDWDAMQIKVTPIKRDTLVSEMGYWHELVYDTLRVFRKPYVLPFIQVVMILFGILFISIGFGTWFPVIRNMDVSNNRPLCTLIEENPNFNSPTKGGENGNDTTLTPQCLDKVTNFLDPILHGCAYMIYYFVATVLVLFIPRKYVMSLHIANGIVAGFCLNFISNKEMVLYCFVAMIVSPGVLIALAGSVMVDVMPVHLRGKALCMGKSIARIGSACGANLVGLVMRASCYATLNIFLGYMTICLILCLLLPK